MVRTLHADLTTAQNVGFPTGGFNPAILTVFKDRTGATIATYSFDPTVTTNRLLQIERREEPYNYTGKIILRNNDLAVPDLCGYYVDLNYGLNTSSGLKYADTAVPRLWVKQQDSLSASGQLYSILILEGVWGVLNEQFVTLGFPPLYQDESGTLTGKTVYGVLEYLIETALTTQTGVTFTLDALGDQDDGIINSLVPIPVTVGTGDPPEIARINPGGWQTYAYVLETLMSLTKCYLRIGASNSFKVVYPQASDSVNETYYSDLASGHVFYEYLERQFQLRHNHITVFSKDDDYLTQVNTVGWSMLTGEWKNPDDFDGTGVFDGTYMETEKFVFFLGALNQQEIEARAAAYGAKEIAETFGGRLVIAHDVRPELYDRIGIVSTRP